MLIKCGKRLLQLDLDLHTGGQLQGHQGLHRLGGGLGDVDEALVGAALKLLAAVLVLVDGPQDGDDFLLGGQRPSGECGSFLSEPWLFPPDFVGSFTSLDDLRRENFSIRLTVRIIPAHEKYRRFTTAGILSWRSDLRNVQILLSRPIIGHTPRKLPLSSNLPVHRSARRAQCRPLREPYYHKRKSSRC